MATITGTSGNDTLTGTSSADTLVGSGGNDFYDGAGGIDTLDFRATATATIVNFSNGTISGGFNGTFTNVERVLAGSGNDSLTGGGGADNLSGRGGADTLAGGAGNDWLWGGGDGAQNRFVFHETGTANADQVGDFISGADKIVLDATVMTALGAEGSFAAGDARFASNTSGTAQDADDRVIYETDTRQVWYDPDGNGAAARQLIATLQSGATLTATDIVVQGAGTPPPGGINGTEGDDTLVGTPGNDTINGLGGNDSISGLAGDDSLSGGNGNDTLEGGPGADTMDGGSGSDTYIVRSGDGSDVFADAGGTDTLISFAVFAPLPSDIENLTLEGGPFNPGADIFTSSGNGNALNNLIVNHRPGSSGLDGGAGNDTLIGSATGTNWFEFSSGGTGNYGNDVVDGNGGAAILLAPGPNVTVNFQTGIMTGGGTGSVSFTNITVAQGSLAADMMIGNDAGVTLYGNSGNDTMTGGVGNDFLSGDGFITSDAPEFSVGNDSLSGGGGNDTILGGRGDDVLNGDAGDDVFNFHIEVDYGHDTVDGGAGTDTVVMSGGAGGVVVDLGAGTMSGGGASGGTDSALLTSIENFTAAPFESSASRITGSAASNVLVGGSSNDTLNGQGGNDTLTGNAGADQFVFNQIGTANADHVSDFVSGTDQIHLDATAMTALGTAGQFAAGDGRFFAAANATAGHDTDDRVVYNTTTGQLFYDPDGNGAGTSQLIATLDGVPAIAATDIAVLNGTTPSVINGSDGNDTLVGTAGPDTINGLGGDDSLVGGGGADSFGGGDGNDTLNGIDHSFGGTDSNVETLDGGLGNDLFMVDNLSDVLIDAGGVDTVYVENARGWTLAAGFENLSFNNQQTENTDTFTGNELNNFIDASRGFNYVADGAGGDDLIQSAGSTRHETMLGGAGNDTLRGASGALISVLDGGDGNDLIIGGPQNPSQTMIGGAGDDTLNPGVDPFPATMTGAIGVDHFVFDDAPSASRTDPFAVITDYATGTDRIHLDARVMTALGVTGSFATGDARFFAGAGATGGHDADDRVVYDSSTGTLYYDTDGNGSQAALLVARLQSSGAPASLAATDIVVDNGTPPPPPPGNTINGTSGNDTLTGTDGNDTLNGLGGNDELVGSGGVDFFDGGSGLDTLNFRAAAAGIAVDFAAGTISGGFNGTFTNMERVLAGNGSDSLTGGAGADNLSGRGGADTLEGGAGNDWLWGGGGGEENHFVFRETGTANADRVGDFIAGADQIDLDNAAMAALGAEGAFATGDGRFFATAGASGGHDIDDRVIYNTSTGQLYYDDDGSGAHAAQLIATLQGAPTLAAADINVI